MTEQLYVPTSVHGHQHHDHVTDWPLPSTGDDGATVPGAEVVAEDAQSLTLLTLDALLERLDHRIFVAESTAGTAESHQGVASVASARLVRETAWDLRGAARFAVDCASHIIGEAASVAFPSGTTFAEILGAARESLEGESAEHLGLIERFGRIATARRLQKSADEIAGQTWDLTIEDEARDLHALDDPAFDVLAAARDAVLSAVEALQHTAFPHLSNAQSSYYDRVEGVKTQGGASYFPPTAFVPAAVAARDAAERARQAAAKAGGDESSEREWQAERLAEALGEA